MLIVDSVTIFYRLFSTDLIFAIILFFSLSCSWKDEPIGLLEQNLCIRPGSDDDDDDDGSTEFSIRPGALSGDLTSHMKTSNAI